MHKLILLIFLIAFPVATHGEPQNVSISILSLLQPRELKLTLLSPASGMLRSSDHEMPILAGKTFEVSLVHGKLRSAHISGEHLSLNCTEGCRVRIQIDEQMDRSYRGQFEFFSDNSTIHIVLQVPQETLIASITTSEMGEAREPEAVTAFAIVSRSFLVDGGRHPEKHADFCDTTHCQVFQNLQATPEITTAVQKSDSLVLTFLNQPFKPYYSRSCGGRTATFQDAWGQHSQPYEFAAVSCPCGDKPLLWQASLSSEELVAITGLANAKLIRKENRIDVSTGKIEKQFPLEVFRTKLGQTYGWNKLPGNNYKLERTSGGYVFQGNGQGHGVGFCQIGAEILAARGLKFSEILSHYFPGCKIKTAETQRGAL